MFDLVIAFELGAITALLITRAIDAYLKHRDAHGRPRIRSTRKLRALAEAIIRMREASSVGVTQAVGDRDDDLARLAAVRAYSDIVRAAGKRHGEWILQEKVRLQVHRRLQRSDAMHEALHQRMILAALGALPTPVLENLAGGDATPIGMECRDHIFELDSDRVATEARRLLLERRGGAE